jgi:GNAT superfamily N-acetyltransferase
MLRCNIFSSILTLWKAIYGVGANQISLSQMYLTQYSADISLRDFTPVHIRAIRPYDKSKLSEHFQQLSEESVFFRFFGAKQELTEEDLSYFTDIDFEYHVALVAMIHTDEDSRIIGVGRYIQSAGKIDEQVAEVAFAVIDEYQNLGVGTILFKRLVKIAQMEGFSKLEADVIKNNSKMLHVFKNSGLDHEVIIMPACIHFEFNLSGSNINF